MILLVIYSKSASKGHLHAFSFFWNQLTFVIYLVLASEEARQMSVSIVSFKFIRVLNTNLHTND